MAKIVDALTKSAGDHLGDETFVAGVRCMAEGHIRKRSIGAGMFGAVGMLAASNKPKDGHAIAGEELPKELALGLTQTRLFVFKVSPLSNKVAELRMVVPITHITGVSSKQGKTFGMKQVDLSIEFVDGNALAVEVPRISFSEGQQFAAALEESVRGAAGV